MIVMQTNEVKELNLLNLKHATLWLCGKWRSCDSCCGNFCSFCIASIYSKFCGSISIRFFFIQMINLNMRISSQLQNVFTLKTTWDQNKWIWRKTGSVHWTDVYRVLLQIDKIWARIMFGKWNSTFYSKL